MASALHNNEQHEDVTEINPRKEIKCFVRNVETPGTFAYGSSLLPPAPNLTVQGLGNIPLPLSNEGVDKLRGAAEVAPFGHGTETKVDEKVRQAWQIDGSLIGLSDAFAEAVGKQFALHAAEALGLRARALGVEARLYKLVMYENGGHFRPHKDTEKEAGMFGTLVVQLPTARGHEGGALVVRHRSKERVFAWQDLDGSYAQRHSGNGAGAGAAVQQGGGGNVLSTPAPPSLPVRCAAFYGDCEHELRPVTKGVRLCLLYNLVRTTPGPPPVAAVGQSGSAAQLRLSDAITAWSHPDGSCHEDKFILPLEHEYTKASLSFGGLKGRDRAMADALRACREIDLYLAHVVKHESGTADEGYGCGNSRRRAWDVYRRKRCKYDSIDEDEDDEDDENDKCYSGDDDDDQEMDLEADVETTFSVKNWVASDDNPVALHLDIDVDSELLDCSGEGESDDDYEVDEEEARELLFPSGTDPDKREYEGYTGNYPPSLEFWYHRSVLILWPASATMNTALGCGVDTALSVARQRSARYGAADALPLADLARIVSLSEGTAGGRGFVENARHATVVLGLCAAAAAAGLGSSRRFLRLLAGSVPAAVKTPGLQSEGLARGLAGLVRVVGWPAIGEDVMRLVKACSLEQAGKVAVAAQELSTLVQQQKQPKVELRESDVGIKVEIQVGQQLQQPKEELQGSGVSTKAGMQAGQQQHAACMPNISQEEQPYRLQESGVGLKTEVQAEQLQKEQIVNASVGCIFSSSSVGALIARTYAEIITSNSDALKRVTADGAAGIVRLLLLDLPCCNGKSALTARNFGELGATAIKTIAEDVVWLAARADGAGGLEQGFAGAVMTGLKSGVPSQVSRAQEQLQAVFKSKAVQAALRGGDGGGGGAVFWRALVSERLRKLEAHAPPVFSWHQPDAIFAEHPQVQQFLRGPEKMMTYTRSGTFSDIKHARNFSYKYFSSSFSIPRHFSARCAPSGRGRNAYVCITKSTEGHDKEVRAYEQDRAEAAVLSALLSNGIGDGSSHGGGSGGSSENRGCEGEVAVVHRVGGGNNLGPSSASGNASGGSATRRAKVTVINLCDSP
ncbi:unnamed protein product [Pylaiella littoralis]